MEMNDLNRGTNNIDDKLSDENEQLLGSERKGARRTQIPGTPMNRRVPNTRGIFGNFKPKGGDQVHPPDIHFSYIASLFIIAPSLFVLIYS